MELSDSPSRSLKGSSAICRLDRVGNILGCLQINVKHSHLGAVPSQAQAGSPTDAAPAASYDDCFAVKFSHIYSLVPDWYACAIEIGLKPIYVNVLTYITKTKYPKSEIFLLKYYGKPL
jgi:hypothetical protein